GGGGRGGGGRRAARGGGKPLAAVCEKPEVWQTWRADPIRHHTLMQRYAQFKALYLNDLKYRQH
ncbi:xylulokinase, partial [Klebsiella pneumoniae]|nr:xylulokinase [Klebsiella pneumoniae]